MTDKYAHLRPPKPRQCYRGDRVPKIRFATKELAEAKAAEYPGYHAYRCPDCDSWHVGRQRTEEPT